MKRGSFASACAIVISFDLPEALTRVIIEQVMMENEEQKTWKAYILIGYLLLLALFFMIIPWTRMWEVSIFAKTGGFATRIYMSSLFRSMITGLGAVTLLAAVEEIFKYFWLKKK